MKVFASALFCATLLLSACAQPPSNSAVRCTGGTAAGALAGALLGNQIGEGTGRQAATIVGAGAGAVAASNATC